MKTKKLNLKVDFNMSRADFTYGNCAMLAICGAFNLSMDAIRIICSFYGINPDSGISYFECKKLITKISKCSACYRRADYTPNKSGIKYGQLIGLFNQNSYLVMFDEHLSYVEKSVIYDTYLRNNDVEGRDRWLNQIPTGWWKIIKY